MAEFGFKVDTNELPEFQERKPFRLITPGDYEAMVTESDITATQKGGKMLKLTFTIVKGEFEGSKIFSTYNIENSNPKAQEFAWQHIGKLLKAIGRSSMTRTEDLHDKRLLISVYNKKEENYIDKDGVERESIKPTITNYESVAGAVNSPTATADNAAAKPWKRA